MQVSAILLEVLDIAISKAVGQCGSESLSPSAHLQNSPTLCQPGRSTTEQKPGSSCQTQTGLLDPNVCSEDAPSLKPTEVVRRELDWQPELLSVRGPICSDMCRPGCSSEQDQVQRRSHLPNSFQEVPIHPSPCSQDFLFFKAIEESKGSFELQAGEEEEEEEEELEKLSPPSYLFNSPNTSELGSIGGNPEMERGESPSLPTSNQDVLSLSSKSIEGEMVNWQTEEENELTPPSFQNSPTTSELDGLQRWGSTPSSMESSPRREGSQHTTTETGTDSKSKVRLHQPALQLLSTSQLSEEIHRADSGNSSRLDEHLPGLEGELISKSKRQRTSNLGDGSPAEMLRGKSVEMRKKNDQVSSTSGNAGCNVEISDDASSDGSYSLEDKVEKEPIRPDSYEEIFDSSSATEVEAPKLFVKDQPKLLHRAPRLGLSRQQNLSSIHQAVKRAFFRPEAENQSFVLEE